MVSATTTTSIGNIQHPDLTTFIIFCFVIVGLSLINRYYGIQIYRFINKKFNLKTKSKTSGWMFD